MWRRSTTTGRSMAEEKIKLKIEYMPVDQLRTFAGNPRKITGEGLKKLERSIGEFGFVNPVLAWRNDDVLEIIAGHQRIKAAQTQGVENVPVIILPFADRQKALAYNVADNRLQDESEWDLPLLKDLMSELDDGIFDIEMTGFELHELADLAEFESKHRKMPGVTSPDDEYQVFSVVMSRENKDFIEKTLKQIARENSFKENPLAEALIWKLGKRE
jgi:hypothetical protein